MKTPNQKCARWGLLILLGSVFVNPDAPIAAKMSTRSVAVVRHRRKREDSEARRNACQAIFAGPACRCFSAESRGLERRQKFAEQGGAVGHAIDEQAFVDGVGAFADGAEAIERGDAEGSRKVAVGAAAGEGFFEFDAEVAAERLSQPEELHDAGRALHRRAVQAAGDFDGAAFIVGLQRAAERGSVAQADADIDPASFGHHVGPRTARDDSRVDDAAGELGEGWMCVDLARAVRGRRWRPPGNLRRVGGAS